MLLRGSVCLAPIEKSHDVMFCKISGEGFTFPPGIEGQIQMTDYSDQIRDFPTRCGEVLDLFYDQAQAKDREVTLLIMTAAAAFLVPFERLRPGMSTKHPAQDRERFPELARHLDSVLGWPFLGSPFHDAGSASWSVGKMPRPKRVEFKQLTKETQANQLLAIIRNALAHGNLWTITGTGSDIEALIFWAEDKKDEKVIGYKYVHVSPTDFRDFLVKWLAFLKMEKLPAGIVAETLARAA